MFGNKRTILLGLILALALFADVANADYIFGTPTNLGLPVNSFDRDWSPSISADGSALYFASNRPGGHGDEDLWQVSINPMPGDFRDDRDSDSAPESDKSNGGKEG